MIQGLMKMAYGTALSSPDTSTTNGAVIINAQGVVVAVGANELPEGVEVTPERLERPVKYAFTEHAERNAIFQAARLGESTQDAVMVVLWAACDDCARAIIQAGIKKVVTHSFYRDYNKEDGADRKDWGDSISTAFQMLKEAGVEVEFVDCEINFSDEGISPPLLFNGEEVWF